MRKRRWLGYLLVYPMWALVLALGLWFLVLSRDAVLGIASLLIVDETTARAWQLVFVERAYVISVGLIWLAMMIVSEPYFRNGVHRGRLFPRFARFLGPELLLLFVADFALFAVQGFDTRVWLRWLVLGAELVAGILFVRAAQSSPHILADVKTSYKS